MNCAPVSIQYAAHINNDLDNLFLLTLFWGKYIQFVVLNASL